MNYTVILNERELNAIRAALPDTSALKQRLINVAFDTGNIPESVRVFRDMCALAARSSDDLEHTALTKIGAVVQAIQALDKSWNLHYMLPLYDALTNDHYPLIEDEVVASAGRWHAVARLRVYTLQLLRLLTVYERHAIEEALLNIPDEQRPFAILEYVMEGNVVTDAGIQDAWSKISRIASTVSDNEKWI